MITLQERYGYQRSRFKSLWNKRHEKEPFEGETKATIHICILRMREYKKRLKGAER